MDSHLFENHTQVPLFYTCTKLCALLSYVSVADAIPVRFRHDTVPDTYSFDTRAVKHVQDNRFISNHPSSIEFRSKFREKYGEKIVMTSNSFRVESMYD